MSILKMKTRSDAGIPTYFDPTTFETLRVEAAKWFKDDFFGVGSLVIPADGSAVDGDAWVKKIVDTSGTPTVAGVAATTTVKCALDATSEKQEATLYFGDQLNFDLTKGVIFEARVLLPVVPSATGVQAVWGLASSWIDGPDNNSYYVEFGTKANGAITCRSQDGVTQNALADANADVVGTTDWHIYRIDMTDVTNIRFYLDGADVTPAAGIAFVATGSNAILQPYLGVYKPSGVGVASLQVDYVAVWGNR